MRRTCVFHGLAGRVGLALVAVLVALSFSACSTSTPCLVTSLGAKLCGSDAAAWCRATDPLRLATGQDTSTAQTLCDTFESEYPGS